MKYLIMTKLSNLSQFSDEILVFARNEPIGIVIVTHCRKGVECIDISIGILLINDHLQIVTCYGNIWLLIIRITDIKITRIFLVIASIFISVFLHLIINIHWCANICIRIAVALCSRRLRFNWILKMSL